MIGMRQWLEPPERQADDGLAQALGLSPWIAEVLARRGLADVETARAFLEPEAYTPAPADELPGLSAAVDALLGAIRQGRRILVWGDFDVDGQTATALLVQALGELGAQVDYHIPIRAQESHGVSPAALRRYLEGEAPPDLVLTCDTGIAAFEAAEELRQRGVPLVITDHHELPRQPGSEALRLPQAQAIVSPRFLPDGHPLASLPGVGVAYKLAEGLYARLGRPEAVEKHLDLAALGIVADVALQTGDARYLLQRGLERLRRQPRLGLQAIYERAELNPQGLNEEHIGFVIAPRLNALGRLGDANPAVELLTTTDRGRARLLALQLEGLNARRQLLTGQVLRGALAQLQQNRALLDEAALVLENPSWEPGVIGIVASRLVELYDRPVVMIAAPPGGPGRASARSVEGVDITAAIATQADLLLGYGGHAMAAGFSIPLENIPAFRRGLTRAVAAARSAAPQAEPRLQIDAYLPWEAISLELAGEIERLAPFGPGNPPLALASRGLRLVNHAALGRAQEHLLLTIEDASGLSRRVIWWGGGDFVESGELPQGTFDLAYRLRARTYRGQDDLQIEYVGFRQAPEAAQVAVYRPQVADHRQEARPLPILLRLTAEGVGEAVQVWAEGEAADQLARRLPAGAVRRRHELCEPAHTLAIWTPPAAPADLRMALQRLRPQQVILFAVPPEEESFSAFVTRLAGLARYALAHTQSKASLARLAAATAQRELTVLRGLEWLAAQGHLSLQVEGDEARLSPGGEADPHAAALLAEQLRDLLDETRAYRAYFCNARDPLSLGV